MASRNTPTAKAPKAPKAAQSTRATRATRTAKNVRETRPALRTEDDERTFWATANTLDHSDEDPGITRLVYSGPPRPPRDRHKGKGVLLRLDASVIDRLKRVASSKGIGYQTLMRVWVMERLQREASPDHARR